MTTTLTARSSAEDLLAVVPVVLGFVPDRLGRDAHVRRRQHLPRPGRPARPARRRPPRWSSRCCEPAVRHGVERVVFVVYTERRPCPPTGCRGGWSGRFREAGIEVVDVLRADGRRWFPLLRSRRSVPASGVPYDVSRAPVRGPGRRRGPASRTPRVTSWPGCSSPTTTWSPGWPLPGEAGRVRPPDEPAWVRATRRSGTSATGSDARRRARRPGCCAPSGPTGTPRRGLVRARAATTRSDHVELWTDLLRRAPDDLAGAARPRCSAFAAWLAGHGALAWCAVDRCRGGRPRPLAGPPGGRPADRGGAARRPGRRCATRCATRA